jgi:hypothetical protein
MKYLITSFVVFFAVFQGFAQIVPEGVPYYVNASIVQPVPCYGTPGGRITVRVPGWGQAPYTYRLGGGAAQQSNIFNNLPAGNYTITVTDATNATITQYITVTQPAKPLAFNASTVPATDSSSGSGCINLNTAGGTPPYSYNWSNGTNTEDICNLTRGSYCVTITDANGCGRDTCITVGVGTLPFKAYATAADATCHYSSNGSILVTVVGDTGTYQYKLNNGAYQGSNLFTGLAPGLYTISVQNSQNQTVVTTAAIAAALPMLVTGGVSPETTTGAADGYIQTAVVNGRAPFSFQWSNTELGQYISGLQRGTYTVTATDFNGCTASTQFIVDTGHLPFFYFKEVTHVRCNGAANGAINLTIEGDNAPYTYQWSTGPTTQDIAGLAGGQYRVTITGANNFVFIDSTTIVVPGMIGISGILNNVTCNSNGDGRIDLGVTGGTPPYRYSWNTGTDTLQDVFNLGAGNYVVTVYDSRNCPVSSVFVVTDPLPVYVVNTSVPVSCSSGGTGPITVAVQGGAPPYTYLWNNNSTDSATTGAPCTYRVRVTDSNGCIDSTVFFVPAADLYTYQLQTAICPGDTYDFRGNLYTEAGIYADTVELFSCGCDTLYQLDLSFTTPVITTLYDTAENAEQYVFDGRLLTQSGTYYDTLVATSGCDSIVVLNFTRVVTSSVASIGNSHITLYPNPAHGMVQVTTGIAGTYSYTLYNLQGQAIAQQTITRPVFGIDISSYPGGLYTLVLHSAAGNVPVRLVRE